jgi:hypothetical protein
MAHPECEKKLYFFFILKIGFFKATSSGNKTVLETLLTRGPKSRTASLVGTRARLSIVQSPVMGSQSQTKMEENRYQKKQS